MYNIHDGKKNFPYSVAIFTDVIFYACSQKYQKAPITFISPVRLPACLIAFPAGKIFIKFGIAGFEKKSCISSRFGCNWTTRSGALHEGLSTFIPILCVLDPASL